MRTRLGWTSVAIAVALGAWGSTMSACKVINPEHCANQALPGNQWCENLSRSTPFCSPCVAAFHGCVGFEPVGCGEYDPAILEGGEDDGDGDSGGSSGGSGGASESGM